MKPCKALCLAMLVAFPGIAHAGVLPCTDVTSPVPRVYDAAARLDEVQYARPLAAADLDGDGATDLLSEVTIGAGTALIALYGKKDGSFEEPVQLLAGLMWDIAVGDVDNDQRLDIVVAPYTIVLSSTERLDDTDIQLIRNLGERTFAAPVSLMHFPFFASALTLNIADFTGDGWPDIHVSLPGYGNTTLINVEGGRHFAPRQNSAAIWTGRSATGDFDGDGKADLVVWSQGAMLLLHAEGNGDFTGRRIPQVPAYVERPFVADVNDDGYADLLWTAGASISILKGPIDDSEPATELPSDRPIDGIVFADFNGDGTIDILAKTMQFSGVEIRAFPDLWLMYAFRMTPWLNDGNGNFEVRTDFDSLGPFFASSWREVIAGDFDADGRLDLAIYENPGRVAIVKGRGDGTFRTPRLPMPEMSLLIGNGDLNGDDIDELLAMRQTRVLVGWRTSAGRYTFEEVPFDIQKSNFNSIVPSHSFCNAGRGKVGSHPVATGDVHAAPGPELVLGDGSKLRVFSRDNAGTWTNPVSFDIPTVAALTIANFDESDALLEILVASRQFLRVVRGDGVTLFSTPLDSSDYSSIQTGDFDRDGHEDLIVSRSGTVAESFSHCLGDRDDGAVLFFRGRGTGTFDPARSIMSDLAAGSIRGGDFNADGHRDLVVASHAPANRVDLLLGDGRGNFSSGPSINENDAWINGLAHAAGDLNGDGIDDLIWFSDARLTFFYGSKAGLVKGGSYHSRNEPFLVRVGPAGERVVMHQISLGEAGIIPPECARRQAVRK